MTTCHLLSDVEQQRIVRILIHADDRLEDMSLTHLALTTFRRGDIHDLTSSEPSTFGHCDTILTGIEIRLSVVIPQDTIAFARNEHGQTDLGIDLRESSRQSSHIAIAILELSEAEETFVFWRVESQHGTPLLQLMV